jgi:catechol 1,2-dioxygenase
MGGNRLRTLVEDLEIVLGEFITSHRVTHQEYRQATDHIIAAIKAGEESLLFDVFLEAQAADVVNVDRVGTVETVQGPFYRSGAPTLEPPYVMPGCEVQDRHSMLFSGRVAAPDGAPLANVVIDMWQADADGHYSSFFQGVAEWNLRGRFSTGADGRFQVTTVVPAAYQIPSDGPTGHLLRALGRHTFRPPHIHVKLTCPGHKTLITQVYFQGSAYLDSDVVHAVRESLIVPLSRRQNGDGQTGPFFEATYDFVLDTDDAYQRSSRDRVSAE